MTDFTKTVAKVQELVPRLMELTRGCAVKVTEPFHGCGAVIHSAEIVEYDYSADLCTVLYSNNFLSKKLKPKSSKENYLGIGIFTETIGHPITLEDVIEAVFNNFMNTPKNKRKHTLTLKDYSRLISLWRCGVPFDHQEEETKQFITDILFS